jgi:acyl carrier protein
MEVFEFLKDTILNLKDLDESTVTPAMPLEDIQLDSLDYVEIQVSVKKSFGVVLDPELFSTGRIGTIADLCSYIATAKTGGGAPQAVAA